MSDKLVMYTIDDSIAIITIDNPPMNPLTTELRDQLLVILDELDSKKDRNKGGYPYWKGKGLYGWRGY